MNKIGNRAAIYSVITIIAMLMANTAWADTITGKVVAVSDGDTLTVLDGRGDLSATAFE